MEIISFDIVPVWPCICAPTALASYDRILGGIRASTILPLFMIERRRKIPEADLISDTFEILLLLCRYQFGEMARLPMNIDSILVLVPMAENWQ